MKLYVDSYDIYQMDLEDLLRYLNQMINVFTKYADNIASPVIDKIQQYYTIVETAIQYGKPLHTVLNKVKFDAKDRKLAKRILQEYEDELKPSERKVLWYFIKMSDVYINKQLKIRERNKDKF